MSRQKSRTSKRYTAAQKAQMVVEMLKEEKSVTQIASEYGVHPAQLYRWKNLAMDRLVTIFDEESQGLQKRVVEYEREVEQLYAEIGRLTTQLAWLKKKSGLQVAQEGAERHD